MRFFTLLTLEIIILLIFSNHSYSQVNIEKFRESTYERGFSGNVGIDLSSRTGNVDVKEVTIESRSDYIWKEMNTFLVVRGEYGWQGGKQYSNEGLIHLRHVFRIKAYIQPEVFAQTDYNKKRLLLFRALAGGGFRFTVEKSSKTTLWWGTAFMMEHERYDYKKNNGDEKEANVIRWSNYISANIIFTERVGWGMTTYIQPRIDDFGDVRILGETNLTTDLAKQLFLIITFRMHYDSKPFDEIKSLDTALGTGLVLDF